MPAKTPVTAPVPKRMAERVRNHAGRVDVLAAKVIDEVVKQQANPTVTMIHSLTMASLVDPLLHYYLGPRNKSIRKVTRIVRTVTREIRRPGTVRRA